MVQGLHTHLGKFPYLYHIVIERIHASIVY